MEVHITSKQMIQPSPSKLGLLKPFKLSLMDQFGVTIYSPAIFFYPHKPNDQSHVDDGFRFSDRLKQSLSKALDHFYPLSGRTKNNLFIHDYHEGVPYVETRVHCRLSDFIKRNEALEAMNKLLPCRPFTPPQVSMELLPQLAIQVNIFDCGGIGLALCCSHKIIDAATIGAFLKSWEAFSRGSNGELPDPNMLEASSRIFPPMESMANFQPTFNFNQQRRCRSRSFVFDADAIATLKLKVESKRLEHPTRVVSIVAFLWKHAIQASRSASGTRKPAVLYQPVNIRPKMKPQLPEYSIGNMLWLSVAMYNSVEEDIELTEMGYLVAEAVKSATHDLLQDFKRIKTKTERNAQIAEMISKGEVDFYNVSSWVNIIQGPDFGWGNPSLFSVPGIDSQEFMNCFILKKAEQHDGIEAWVNLSDEAMGFLEHDPDFLAFASPNPHIYKTKI